MVDLVASLGRLLIALVLVVLNGFFVASEFALVRIRSTSVEQLADAGRPGSGALQDAMENLDDFLATTQLGITVASLGLGWAGEPAVAALLEPALESVLSEGTVHLVAFAIGFSIITFLHVVFGELAPKTIAIQRAEGLALLIAPPMKLFYYLFFPGIVVFNGAANGFTRLLGVPPASETDETLGEDEIRLVLSRSGRKGLVDHEEVEMIRQVFELDDTTATEVLVPRPDVVSVEPDATMADLRALVEETGHTRYPVVGDEDSIEGFVDVKDALTVDDESVTAGDLARDLPVVPELTRIDELLRRFRAERVQIAAVIDEFGALEGIVTVEDVLEEVVGDLRDRFDAPGTEPSIQQRGDSTYELDGRVRVSQAAERLDADLGDGSRTVGGVVLNQLGHAPEVGDTVETGGYVLEVTGVDGMRVSTVVARPAADAAGSG
jgi:CBS domain containing-hemolysin-like protein